MAPGSAEISASAGDGKYTDSIAVTVTGERFTMPTSGTLELDQTILNYTSISTTTMQIPSEKLHGIYFLQGSSLFFYSLVTQTYEQVYNFSDCTNAYTTGDMLYVVSQSRISVYDLQTQSLFDKFGYPDILVQRSVRMHRDVFISQDTIRIKPLNIESIC